MNTALDILRVVAWPAAVVLVVYFISRSGNKKGK